VCPRACICVAPATCLVSCLSLHDALPICRRHVEVHESRRIARPGATACDRSAGNDPRRSSPRGGETSPHLWSRSGHTHSLHIRRSEEHTSELQSRVDLVCRLLLEKKKKRE